MRDSGWRSALWRALTRFALGRRLWWRVRRRNEVGFWAAWLNGAPGTEQWAADRESRLRSDTEVRDPLVRWELERALAEQVSILDVGAGPVTSLGYRYRGKQLEIVPVDSLADEYEHLLRTAGLEPPIWTKCVAGEALLGYFGPDVFDIAYACNALDHSAEPLTVISNMVHVVRPGGVLLLRHKRNEGMQARYGGLHQWNFDVLGSSLILWRPSVRIDVGAALARRAETTAWLSDGEVIARIVVRDVDPFFVSTR